VVAAGAEHGGHFAGVGGSHDRARHAPVTAGPVDLEGGAEVVVDEDVALADRRREVLEQDVGHM
jgi:hypothetical protein